MAPRRFEEPSYSPPKLRGRPRRAVRVGENGHTSGTATQEMQASRGEKSSALVQITCAPVVPRLLDLHAAAAYLALSPFTIRELEAKGVMLRVRIPLPGHQEVRKLLFDRTDLDRLIESWKEARPDA